MEYNNRIGRIGIWFLISLRVLKQSTQLSNNRILITYYYIRYWFLFCFAQFITIIQHDVTLTLTKKNEEKDHFILCVNLYIDDENEWWIFIW